MLFSRCILLLFTTLLSTVLLASEQSRTGSYTTSFDSAAAYATADTIFKRMSLGEVYRAAVSEAQNQDINLKTLTVSPAEETWDIYVPGNYSPNRDYGVLVWIPGDQAAPITDSWKNTLEKHKLIYIAAQQSGSAQPTLERRVPLALHGLNGLVKNYSIDPTRIYIGGSSGGGAIIAGNMAISFPDIFHGAVMLNDGPVLGTASSPIPYKGQLNLARKHFYAFLAPRDSTAFRQGAAESARSFEKLCIKNITIVNRPGSGDENLLDTGIAYIDRKPSQILDNGCIQRIYSEAKNEIAKIQKLIDNNKLDDADKAWQETYLEYGNIIDKEMHGLQKELGAIKKQRKPNHKY